MAKEKRKFAVGSGEAREQKFSTGLNPSFQVPPGIPMWKPKKTDKATHTIDILPFLCSDRHDDYVEELRFNAPGSLYGERTFKVHARIGVNEQSYTCLAQTFGKPCPVCQEISKLKESPHQLDTDKAYKLKPRVRQLFLIYDHDDKDKGIQLWEIAHWNFGQFLDAYIAGATKKDRPAYRKYYDPYDGFTLRLMVMEKTIETGKNYEYHIHQFIKRDEDLPDELVEHGIDLDMLVRELDYNTLKAVYHGVAEDEDAVGEDQDENQEADERPARSMGRRPEPTRNGAGKSRDEEPEPEPEKLPDLEFASGDEVEFDDNGDTLTGKIVKVSKADGQASVKVDGYNRPITVEFADLRMVKQDDTFDAKPEPQAQKPAGKPTGKPPTKPTGKPAASDDEWGDDDDDGGRVKPPTKSPGKRK